MRKTDTEPLTDGEGISAASIGTGNAGFIYERDVILALRNSGFTVSDPAGADSAKADLELTSGFKTIKFELKEKLSADFAQMNFDFDTTSKQFFIGLYYMGKDPEGYGCPRFSNSVTDSSIRIRIKTNSASKARWSFLMALKINGLRASNRDLDLDSSFLSS